MANGRSWVGSIYVYMEIEELLSKYNLNLKFLDSYGGNFFDWVVVNDDYSEEILYAIEKALSDERIDVVIEDHLLIMREVFKNGRVIMG
ncbi:MAG: hypothetical protein HXY47_08110 [Nitrospirae bacterium]|nr:hypothetical protein [Nitrospirota bacterium]